MTECGCFPAENSDINQNRIKPFFSQYLTLAFDYLQPLILYRYVLTSAYDIEINAKRKKLMSISDNGIQTDITANREKLETVKNFKYLGAIVSD